jgi:hypothetical protein
MVNKRTSISNKTRFEVFRRDSFKCQYCGKSAPDIILNVDHIHPVAKGGTSDVFNLITSCFECNQGKKARVLGDENEVSKQKKQLDLLNERRIQLDMLLQWKTGLVKKTEDQSSKIAKYLLKKLGTKEHSINEFGKLKLKSYLKKITPERLIELIDETIDDLSDNIGYFGISDKTFEIIFSVLNAKYRSETSTLKQKIAFILKKCDYHFGTINEKSVTLLKERLEEYFEEYNDVESYINIQKSVKECKKLQSFYDSLCI